MYRNCRYENHTDLTKKIQYDFVQAFKKSKNAVPDCNEIIRRKGDTKGSKGVQYQKTGYLPQMPMPGKELK